MKRSGAISAAGKKERLDSRGMSLAASVSVVEVELSGIASNGSCEVEAVTPWIHLIDYSSLHKLVGQTTEDLRVIPVRDVSVWGESHK